MNVQKGKPSVSPPVQIATQPQHIGIASAPPTGHTPPLLRTEEIQIFPQASYPQVQSYSVQQGPIPHDMNKQQSAAAALMPPPGVSPQQQGIYQQQPGGLRTAQTAQYFPGNQPQAMRPQQFMGPRAQPNPMYPVYQYTVGQTQGQGYPSAGVMVQQQQMVYPQNQRMAAPQYPINSQAIHQQMAAASAQFPTQPAQQYSSAPQYQMYYGQTLPIAQPSRPPPGSNAQSLMKRERKPIPIIDPTSGQEVHTEAEAAAKTPPPSGSARSTPVGRQQPESSPPPVQMSGGDICAQFAAQVAATLRPSGGYSASTSDMEDASPTPESEPGYNEPTEVLQQDYEQEAYPLESDPVIDVATNAEAESCVGEPQQVDVEESVVEVVSVAPETIELEVVGSSVDYTPEASQELDQSSLPNDRMQQESSPVILDEHVSVVPVQVPPPTVKSAHPVETLTKPEEMEKPAPAVVSVADVTKEETPPPAVSEVTEESPEDDDESASTGGSTGKDGRQKGGKKKIRDLNKKGDEKEGTDMDAFLDAEQTLPDQQGAPVEMDIPKPAPVVVKQAPVVVQDHIGKDTVSVTAPEPVNNVSSVPEEKNEVEIEIKNSEQSEVSLKNAKNDEKTNEVTSDGKPENSEEKKPVLKYKYKEDQWSPLNLEGKMQYDRDFLLQLQYAKDSMRKPDALPNFPEIIPDKPPSKPNMDMRDRVGGGGPGGFHVPDFTPGFLRPTRMSGGGGGPGGSMNKRGSMQRNRSDVKVIKGISLQHDIKLNQAENAWKPSHREKKEEGNETITEELYRKVRSILNKLTPQKFQTLIKQVQGLVIDTETRLKGVTDIIFEKAISEPAFSVAYANMCRYLLTLKVPSDTKQGETVNFRVILLTRCQREFEKDNDVQNDLDLRKKALEEAPEEKKKELSEDLALAVSKAKRRSIGNIRFIGELFKLKMLTENIMHDCVFKLLRSRDEENLECLCRLLTTIGKELESEKAKPRMDQYFQQMKKIVAEKKVSSRCRFMLQDVIDLRNNNWKPRRDENNPKTIDQIHKDAKREAEEQSMLTALHIAQQQSTGPPQHQSRHNKPTRGRPNQGVGVEAEGWNTVSSKAIRNIDRGIDVSKLRIEKNADENIQLGPARSFGGWGRGSSGGGSRASKEGDKPNAPNKFSALNKEDDQRNKAFGRGVSPARGDSRTRASTPGGFTRGKVINRSSQEMERERAIASARSLVSGRPTPPSSREGSRTRAPREAEKPVAAPVKEFTEEEMEKKTLSIIDEYLHIQDTKEAILCVQEINSPKTLHFFVYYSINHVLERSKQARQQTGHLLHDLINQKVMSVDTYLQGLSEILSSAEDMEIDIPKIWQYLGELIGPMIQDGSVPLSFLNTACEPLKPSGKAGHVMAEVLHDASRRLGHKIVAHLWRNNCMDWSFFVPQDKIQQFLIDKNLEFTVSQDSAPTTPTSKVSIEWIKRNLSELIVNPKFDNENVFDWIEANVPDEITKENRFIRALMTVVCSSAVIGTGNLSKVDQDVIKKWRALLLKYLDHQPEFELQAIFALQALVHSLEHPSGVLRTFFDTLYDEEIISEDAFNQWETTQEEPEGKGVALKQVVQFFAWLKEGEEEEADS